MDRLTALLAFVRLIEVGSFSAVAEELQVQQSTVSKWLMSLEEELDALLLERTTRAHRMTEAGALLYERARDILAAYEDVTATLQAGASAPKGRVRLSLPVVFGRRVLLPHLSSFLAEHPGIELELCFDEHTASPLEEGIDVSVRVGLPIDANLTARALGAAPRRLVAAPSYLGGTALPLTHPVDLSRHSCLLRTGLSVGDTWMFRRGDDERRVRVRGRISADHSEALLSLAKDGHGIALLAAWLVDEDIAAGRLVSLFPGWEPPRAPVQALLRPGRAVHPRVHRLLDFLATRLQDALEPYAGPPPTRR